MFCPWHNRRMQKWFGKVMDLQCSNVVALPDGRGEITIPTLSFNVIYILSHLYRHVFTEGIGLRQLLDYYFVIEKVFSTQSYRNSFSNHPVPLSKEGSTFSPSPSPPSVPPCPGDRNLRKRGCSWLRYRFARVLVSSAEPVPTRGCR